MDLIGKPRGKSMVWIYFGFKADERGRPLNADEAICRLCRKIVLAKGNTTNLRSHLKRRHPVEFLASLAPSTSGTLSEAQGNVDHPSAFSAFKTSHATHKKRTMTLIALKLSRKVSGPQRPIVMMRSVVLIYLFL